MNIQKRLFKKMNFRIQFDYLIAFSLYNCFFHYDLGEHESNGQQQF